MFYKDIYTILYGTCKWWYGSLALRGSYTKKTQHNKEERGEGLGGQTIDTLYVSEHAISGWHAHVVNFQLSRYAK